MTNNIDYTKYPNPCLVKITAGNRFLIVKTKNLAWLFTELNKMQKKYVAQGVNKTNTYLPLIEHLYRRKLNEVSTEVLLHTENGYDILKMELELLREHYGTERCLNINSEPYIPAWNPKEKSFNWLTQNQLLNYYKLVKKLG
jgi:hypothetical protein